VARGKESDVPYLRTLHDGGQQLEAILRRAGYPSIVAVFVVALVVVGGCGGANSGTAGIPAGPAGSPAASRPVVLTGMLRLAGNYKNGYVTADRLHHCIPVNTSYGISEGMQVQLMDESGSLIAIDSLRPGSPATLGTDVPFVCQYAFQFIDVPVAKFYKVRVGLHDAPAESYEQLQAAGWMYDPLVLR